MQSMFVESVIHDNLADSERNQRWQPFIASSNVASRVDKILTSSLAAKMTKLVLPALCALLFVNGCAPASEGASDAVFDAPVRIASDLITKASGEGASGILRIKYKERVLLESGFGSASCTKYEDVTPGHVFMIGSITKEFTSVLGFVLEEKGVFSLDDTVSQVLPDFNGPIGQVSLLQLMEHTGGLPDIIDENGHPIPYTVQYDYLPVSRDQLIARAELAELISEPGQGEEYSNLGYQLLAAIYEVTTGETYPNLLRRYVYAPAGIRDTDFWFKDAKKRNFADGCRSNDEHWGNPVDDNKWGEPGPSWNLVGAGGLLSTAESLANFFEGIGSGAYFKNPETVEAYKSLRMVHSERRHQRVMGSGGSNGIFNAVAFWSDNDRFSVILMTNRADHPAEGGLVQDIVRAFPPELFIARSAIRGGGE